MASLRQAMKALAKERDQYRRRAQKKFLEANTLATGKTFRAIVNALHPHVTTADLKEAQRLFIALRPLFD
jgi:hypothetical protein